MKKIQILLLIIVFIFLGKNVLAETENFNIHLDHKTIEKGYTVTAFEDDIKLSLVPGILAESTEVDVLRLSEEMDMPWRLNRISSIYQFEFKNKEAYDNHKPFYIQLSYDTQTNNYKKVYFFDKGQGVWRPLPTRDFPDEKFVRSLIHLPYARIAVFSYPEVLTVGQASWYAHKGGNFAASPDFPKGSVVRVFNTDNNKFVDVAINDWGPDRSIFPNRPIDLDKVAFSRIASLGAGVVNVRLEPLIIKEKNGRVLNVLKDGAAMQPEIKASSAIVYNETEDKVLWSKNIDNRQQLASLTKLIFAKVFLDTKPDLEKLARYDIQDEKITFVHVDYDYEAVKLALEPGTKYKIKDLLYSSLIASTNNTVETLVRVSGLKRDIFLKKMNELAKASGADSTVFTDPTGLSVGNFSTVSDYSKLMKAVMENKIIGEITRLPEHKMTVGREKTIRNTNSIVRWSWTDGIVASKTGYLHESGHCLTMRVKDYEGNSVTIVIFNADTRDQLFNEMLDLIDYAKIERPKNILKIAEKEPLLKLVEGEELTAEIETKKSTLASSAQVVHPFGMSNEEWENATGIKTKVVDEKVQDVELSWYQPKPKTTWQWQLTGNIDTSYDVEMYDIDLFETLTTTIKKLHDDGKKVICYFSAGTVEDFRIDAKDFSPLVIGKVLENWSNEKWLDVSKYDSFADIMLKRMDLAVEKNCDGIEPDNVDAWTNESGFDLKFYDQLKYAKWLATEAHNRGLSIGLKNNLEQVKELVNEYDFAVNEQCFQYEECGVLKEFTIRDKAVFGVEYELSTNNFCAEANNLGYSWLKMDYDLSGGRVGCEYVLEKRN